MINLHSSDSEKFFHIAIAQSKPQLEIHCLKYNGFRESMMLVHLDGVWFKPKLNRYHFDGLTRQNRESKALLLSPNVVWWYGLHRL
jgi:phage terminase large subunit-like protein